MNKPFFLKTHQHPFPYPWMLTGKELRSFYSYLYPCEVEDKAAFRVSDRSSRQLRSPKIRTKIQWKYIITFLTILEFIYISRKFSHRTLVWHLRNSQVHCCISPFFFFFYVPMRVILQKRELVNDRIPRLLFLRSL